MKIRSRVKSLAIASTGAANLASVAALCRRAGIETNITDDPDLLLEAPYALLPGVGAFGPAMKRLEDTKLGKAFVARIADRKPTMGICLGMQLMCESSAEAPGTAGLGVVKASVQKLAAGPGAPLPQLGWNEVRPSSPACFVRAGWAYFANSYALSFIPQPFAGSTAVYGREFVASLELWSDKDDVAPYLLLCQFHPELSGPWGLALFRRWMGVGQTGEL